MKCEDPECLTGDHGEPWRCTAHKSGRDEKTGKKIPCKRARIKGATVCNTHGSAKGTPARKAARERLNDMVDLALNALTKALERADADARLALNPAVQRAALAVLDRTGYPAGLKIGVEDNRESRAWAQYLTVAEHKAMLEIQERCFKRMEAAGEQAS